MKAPRILLIGLAATSLAGCAASTVSGPVEVTRFHLGAPLERGTIAVEPLPGGGPASLEFSTYAGAVQSELVQAGYNPAAAGASGQYLAVVGFTRTTLEGAPRPAPFTVGLGGGISFPIGKSKSRYVVATELSVQIRRRSDGTVIWEGRAQTQADDRAPEAQATAAAGKLAHALFLGFPGESGRSITVK